MTENILKLEDVTAVYDKNIILNAVSISVSKGQFVGLLGSNGSGKTTLLKIIAGELTPKTGNLIFNNANINSDSIIKRLEKGLVYIHQFPIVFPDLFAWENILIWNSALKTKRQFLTTKATIIRYITNKLSALSLSIPLEMKTSELSEGDLQVLEFSRCFITDPKIILVDEATSILDYDVSSKILNYLKFFCAEGGAVIFISHRITELKKFSDIIYELKNRKLNSYLPIELKSDQSAELKNSNIKKKISNKNDLVLDIEILLNSQKQLILKLFKNEILGITGLDGSQYEHISEKVFQIFKKLRQSETGKKYRMGKDFAVLGKNRETDWIYPLQTLEFNLAIANKNKILSSRNKNEIIEWIEYFKIFPKEPFKIIDEFSGGNKLKTALGRTLLLKCPINILDEPFTGVDTNSRQGIIEIIANEVEKCNSAFIIFSKDYNELLKCCHRLIAFKNDGSYEIFESEKILSIQKENLELTLFN